MQKIMIIRHAEKHLHGMEGRGIDKDGHPSHHELTVRGWQRAGALVHFFRGAPAASPVQCPRTIFATNATRESPSLRAMHTAKPLAEALGLHVNHDFTEDEEAALAQAACSAPSPVLIVWHHGRIVRLARHIAGEQIGCPASWPDDCFDMVWILERGAAHGAWTFQQVPQYLLSGDRPA